jgi:hypothetical protein
MRGELPMKKIYIVGNGKAMDDVSLLKVIRDKFPEDGTTSINRINPEVIREMIDEDSDDLLEIEHMILDPNYVDFIDAVRVTHSCGIHVDNQNTMHFGICVWIYQDGELKQL